MGLDTAVVTVAATLIVVIMLPLVALPIFSTAWWVLQPLSDRSAQETRRPPGAPVLRRVVFRFITGPLGIACAYGAIQTRLLSGVPLDWRALAKVPQDWFWTTVYVAVAVVILSVFRWMLHRFRARSIPARSTI